MLYKYKKILEQNNDSILGRNWRNVISAQSDYNYMKKTGKASQRELNKYDNYLVGKKLQLGLAYSVNPDQSEKDYRNQLNKMGKEQKQELSKIPSAKIGKPYDPEEIRKQNEKKEDQNNKYEEMVRQQREQENEKKIIDNKKSEAFAERLHKYQGSNKQKIDDIKREIPERLNNLNGYVAANKGAIAGVAGIGAAAATYAAYKMAKKNKWKNKGCNNLSGSEKIKCQEYLRKG